MTVGAAFAYEIMKLGSMGKVGRFIVSAFHHQQVQQGYHKVSDYAIIIEMLAVTK